MEQDQGVGGWVWGVAEVVNVAVKTQAADDGGTRGSVHTLALGTDGDFAVVADTHWGLLAPDEGPPRASGHGA